MSALAEPLTVAVVDEQTRAELEPPCEATTSYWRDGASVPSRVDRCDKPAAIVVRVECTDCAARETVLLCEAHGEQASDGSHGTGDCDGSLRLLSWERL